MRILVVEDDVQRNGLLCSLLVDEGFTVTPAYDFFEAVNFIKMTKFDVIVSDVVLGSGPDGFQVYKAFKDYGGGGFVLYTSSSFPGLATLAGDVGILNFIANAHGNLLDIKKAVIERLDSSIKKNTETTNKLLGLQ